MPRTNEGGKVTIVVPKRRFWRDLRWQLSKRNWYVVYAMTLGRLICRVFGCSSKRVPAVGACARCLH